MTTTIRGWACATLLVALSLLSVAADAAFCWRESYGRGVGTIPTGCDSGKQNDAGLCYTACKPGYGAAGPVCWGNCPAGMSDHGAGCTKPQPYGRGAGYPWKFGDALNDNGMFSRCRAANPQGCEKNGAIVYPKCKAGFHNVGCCICSPNCPSGFADSGATCIKPTYGRGAGTIPTGCGGKQNDAGLCYPNCKGGYSGVGPVCWGKCPASMPVNCGAGCADTQANCNTAVTEQVLSVVEVAANIALTVATAGTGTAATAGAKAATKTAATAATKSASKGITKAAAKEALRKAAKEAGQNIAENQLEEASKAAAGEEWDPYSLDPTGIAQIVKAYNHKKCAG